MRYIFLPNPILRVKVFNPCLANNAQNVTFNIQFDTWDKTVNSHKLLNDLSKCINHLP